MADKIGTRWRTLKDWERQDGKRVAGAKVLFTVCEKCGKVGAPFGYGCSKTDIGKWYCWECRPDESRSDDDQHSQSDRQ